MTGKSLVHAGEVSIPRDMDGLGILSPVFVHFLNIVCIRAICEGIVRRGRNGGGEASSWTNGMRATRYSPKDQPTQHVGRARSWTSVLGEEWERDGFRWA